ncbi:Rv3235 family protein [Cryobacterium roopkundense]|uniref:3-hydroxyacyl-CoA dehydrogenase n=2 Tax=Cryobacterium roopkundense TaxID=1001240 RepID=A0A7W8ZXY5_9MICO|nr:Rv3235 family protein [Cryobacterium roopkundense]MBB5642088.1 hypothetical protein [Cryobacterium roopkundense]
MSLAAHVHHSEQEAPLWEALGMPDPAPMARNLARCAVEALAGAREPEELARWVTDAVYHRILHRALISARARAMTGRPAGRPVIGMGSVWLCEPRPGIVEASVVVHTSKRVLAVALRIEATGTRWRASVIGVL